MWWLYVLVIMLILVFGTMIRAGFIGAPWVPTFNKTGLKAIELANIKAGDIVYDLGCGDGRWLFKAAKKTKAKLLVGYEISVLPYVLAKIRQLFSCNRRRIKIEFKNFYQANLSQADVVYCFGLPAVLAKLENKLEQELKPGSRLVSYCFSLPNKQPKQVFRFQPDSSAIFLYSF